jgi:hypothetical protein
MCHAQHRAKVQRQLAFRAGSVADKLQHQRIAEAALRKCASPAVFSSASLAQHRQRLACMPRDVRRLISASCLRLRCASTLESKSSAKP